MGVEVWMGVGNFREIIIVGIEVIFSCFCVNVFEFSYVIDNRVYVYFEKLFLFYLRVLWLYII